MTTAPDGRPEVEERVVNCLDIEAFLDWDGDGSHAEPAPLGEPAV